MFGSSDQRLSDDASKIVRERITRDRQRVGELRREVAESLNAQTTTIVPDITGRPGVAKQQLEWQRERIRGLQQLERDLFFAAVESRVTSQREKDAPLCLLITEARGTGSVGTDDTWCVVSWTDPLAQLTDAKPGDRKTFQVSNRAPPEYVVESTGKFEKVLPKLRRIQYRFTAGDFHFGDEDAADQIHPIAAAESTHAPYQAASVIGLGDIIATADGVQRAAMHLPFAANILIEGPPGSGKTSVGLMRIACLLDQQWSALGRERDKERGFHEPRSMRVLVYNDEMVDYLRTLVQSTGVNGVRVETTRSFMQTVCRTAGTLSGRMAKERASVAMLKGQREVLPAYWAGFKRQLAIVWGRRFVELHAKLNALGTQGVAALTILEQWHSRIETMGFPGDSRDQAFNLAEPMARWRRSVEREMPELLEVPLMPPAEMQGAMRAASMKERERILAANAAAKAERNKTEEMIERVKLIVGDFFREAVDRGGITVQMFSTDEYAAVVSAAQRAGAKSPEIERGEKWWRAQYGGSTPTYTEYDAILASWLGAKVSLLTSTRSTPVIGGSIERLSHIVVDEAQDLSPAHIALLRSVLVSDGTLTLVGDLRQSLNTGSGLRHWKELGFQPERRAFEVNYRQSAELGRFVLELHRHFYQETPVWTPTERWTGPIPVVRRARSWKSLAKDVADKCRRAKKLVPACTVAVLYDKKYSPQRLAWLRNELETYLADLLPSVQVVEPASRGAQLRDTDTIVIASVPQTKGLEFDAVVYIDSQPRWSGPSAELPRRRRNGLYVAASRARQYLAFVMNSLPECFAQLAAQGVCVVDDGTVEETR